MSGAVDDVGLQARLGPDRLALTDLTSGRQWTYAALDADIARCAGFLDARGIGGGERVAVLARNCAEFILLHHACARIGAIFVPLNWRLTGAEIVELLRDIEPALLLGDDHLATHGLNGEPIEALAGQIAKAAPLPLCPIDRERPSLILYTSGTSGQPKGALLSERNIAATAHNFGLLGQIDRNDAILCDSPMFHVIGLVTSIRPFLQQGAALHISDGFNAARTLARLADPALAISHYFCVPQTAAALRGDPAFDPSLLKGLKALLSGGAPHAATSIRAWLADGIPVVDGYGMSEVGTVFGMPFDLALLDARAGSVGVAAPAVASRVVDAQDRDVPSGTPGELLVKGDHVSAGYWRQPAATQEAFSAEGWFRTGDVVVADQDGYHWIVDRQKDMFISGGENVYPAQIEAALADFPGLREVAVVGVPDSQWGEVGHVAAVVEEGVALDLAMLLEHLGERVARYKLPKRLSLHDALPRTGSGKIRKNALRSMVISGGS